MGEQILFVFRMGGVVFFVPAKLGFYPRDQLQRTKWFRNIVIRSERKTFDLIQFSVFGRQHDDRISMLCPDLLTQCKSVDLRKHDIWLEKSVQKPFIGSFRKEKQSKAAAFM